MPIQYQPIDEMQITPTAGRAAVDLAPPEPEAYDKPDLAEVGVAALRQQNTIGSLIGYGLKDRAAGDESFDPFQYVPEQYKGRASAYAYADNQDEVDAVTARLDRETTDRDVLARSGVPGMLLQIGAGAVDPINLIPIGGTAYRTYRTGGSVLRAAGATALSAGAAVSAQEAILHASQTERTFGESALNVGSAVLLGGLLGGVAGKIAARGELEGIPPVAKLQEKLDADLNVPPPEVPDIRNFEGVVDDRVRDVKPGEKLSLEDTGQIEPLWGNADEYVYHITQKEANLDSFRSEGIRASEDGYGGPGVYFANTPEGTLYNVDKVENGTLFRVNKQALVKEFGKYSKDNPGGVQFDDGTGEIIAPSGVPAKYVEVKGVDGNWQPLDPTNFELTKPAESIGQIDKAGSVGAMKIRVTTRNDERIANALGVDKAVAFQDPLLRILGKSPSIRAAQLIQELGEVPFKLNKNYEGVATPQAVETLVGLRDNDIFVPMRDVDNLFVQHRLGRAAQFADMTKIKATDLVKAEPGKLTYDQFLEEVGKAMRRGDVHEVAEVQSAAQRLRKVFDKYKDEAIALKMLPEDVKPEGAASYLSRVYNRNKVAARRPEFVRRLMTWLTRENPQLQPVEAEELANFFTDRILGNAPGRTSYDLAVDPNTVLARRGTPGRANALKQRSLSIPDAEIEDFLESNVDTILRRYVHSLGSDLELKKRFGSINLDDQLEEIRKEYDTFLNNAPNEKARLKLQKRFESDRRDLLAVRDRIRKTYGMSDDPGGVTDRVQTALMNYNFITKLGGMMLSAAPDLMRPIMTQGLLSVGRDGLLPLMEQLGKGRKALGLSLQEVNEAAIASEHVMGRAMSLAELTNMYGRGTVSERLLAGAANNFGHLTGMNLWNVKLKQFSGLVVQNKILRSVVDGTNKSKLAAAGIDDNMAARIADQFKKFGGQDRSLRFAGTENWTDAEAATALKAAIRKEVNTTIVTPGVADRPLWLNKPWLKLVGQFRSFFFSSMQRVVIRGAQDLREGDMNVVAGALGSVALGMMVSTFKAWQGGYEIKKTPAQFILEGIDRSGMTGWLFDANNIAEKATRGRIGLTSAVSFMTGENTQPLSRFSTRNVWGAILGPSFGAGEDFFRLTGSAGAGEWSQSDTRALRRMLPYQNLWYIRNVFDKLEAGANDAMGLEK